MKILHLALQAPYNEGWGYQENLLTKYQAKAGHDVTLITTCMMNNSNAKITVCAPEDYISPDGFRVIRLQSKKVLCRKFSSVFQIFEIYDLLKSIAPDFIMVHGLGTYSVLQVKKYVKKINPKCTVVADNHLDYNNCPMFKKGFKNYLLRLSWRIMNKGMQKYYSTVYGVAPKRVDVITDIFGIPSDMTDLLPAGADNDMIDFENRDSISSAIRKKHNIEKDDFLIIAGGKIDNKKNIDVLMEAICQIDRDDVKLIVFGNCSDEMQPRIEAFSKHKSIRYIGWISSENTYNYFLAADLIVFPGLHSVMWEQACAAKTPCLFRYLDGFNHIDVGGNCDFLEDITTAGIKEKVESLIFTEKYFKMKEVANSEKTSFFLYSEIAKKSLETRK